MNEAVVAVLGERIIDLVPRSPASAAEHVDENAGYTAIPGGSPANVALALARLGLRPLLLARAGDDALSRLLDERLTSTGLDATGVLKVGGLAMLAVCVRQVDGSMHYTFYHRDSPDLSWTPTDLTHIRGLMQRRGARAWHTGSLVSWLGDGVLELLDSWKDAANRGDLTLSYDPNARPAAASGEQIAHYAEQFIAAAHIVKASDEDVRFMYPDQQAEEVCARWADSGPALVVLTEGAQGATAWRPGGAPVAVPGFAVDVVDTVGAGDTVSAALLAGLQELLGQDFSHQVASMDDDSIAALLTRACAAAAITCSRAGAQPPTESEVSDFLSGPGRVTGPHRSQPMNRS